jgi:hypothetical protein
VLTPPRDPVAFPMVFAMSHHGLRLSSGAAEPGVGDIRASNAKHEEDPRIRYHRG